MKFITIQDEQKNSWISNFIKNGLSSIGAADHLTNCIGSNFSFLYTSVILCHHGLESLFKACIVYEKNKNFFTHDLVFLLSEIDSINLDSEEQNEITKINDYFFYRYPLDKDTFEKIKANLESIGSETIPGMTDLPHEIGTDDIEKAINLFFNVVNTFVDTLKNIYDDEFQIYDRLNKINIK
ncbi:TPA: hypothetical protein ACIZB4_002721 [Legionella pneumophila]|nr:hypothetical protein [Legionella pneumophila]HEL8431269.1 hypothetical protein [Legionella pneumophila]HEL8483509.1 hypothetical protein [Legionella pneumophila]HEL9672933.1 hypothetical protein [Legionella pneumophila]HEL9689045.1 hypothetical protein [Legionella pneumophila]